MTGIEKAIEETLRTLAPEVLGAVVRRYGNFADAEDSVQEALLAAALAWPAQGLPENPRAWLIQVAARRMVDRVRSETARRMRESATAVSADTLIPAWPPDAEQDDTLTLLFLCCHPALTPSSAIALTLRAVGGLTTAEIAHAFLVPEATMAQRISRAKQTIRASGIPFETPAPAEWNARLETVMRVLYLIFNEGYTASTGRELQRVEMAEEAIRLTRLLQARLPDHAEAAGLLALMLLTDARRDARTNTQGELIPLPEQNRGLWNASRIREGIALLSAALPRGAVGPYQLQAAIAAVHDEAGRAEDTDWPQILALYTLLKRMQDNPMVALNHAVAHAMVHGCDAGIGLLDSLQHDERIANHHRLAAVRGHLLEMSGNYKEAVEQYRRAASQSVSFPERDYLLLRAARLEEPVRQSCALNGRTSAPRAQ